MESESKDLVSDTSARGLKDELRADESAVKEDE